MRLPVELRLDIYERVFNASLDRIKKTEPRGHVAVRQDMLRTLHINKNIREESKENAIKLANHHIDGLEVNIRTNEAACHELPKLAEFGPAMQVGWKLMDYVRFAEHLGALQGTMALDANKADALYVFLKMMRVPREGRAYVQRFRRFSRKLSPARRELDFWN